MNEAVTRLWDRFRPLVAERLALIEAYVDGDPAVSREDAMRMAHNLAGSLGSYGRPAGSEAARHIEVLLSTGGTAEPDPALRDLITRLRAAVDG